MVKIPCFHSKGKGLLPGQGTKIPNAMQHSQKTNKQKITVSRHTCRDVQTPK